MMESKQFAPATQRNREPILAVLRQYLPPTGTILEIASGTGEHAVFFAPHFPKCWWIPSDPNPLARASITAWRAELLAISPAVKLTAPIDLDVQTSSWPIENPAVFNQILKLAERPDPIQAIVNINMIHISPWASCLGLMAGAQRVLSQDGILYLYGPFLQADQPTAPSNEAFDASLKAQNPAWGIRQLENVITIADQHGLTCIAQIEMPANNLSVLFKKRALLL